jgi:molybdopterin molybdotransferase
MNDSVQMIPVNDALSIMIDSITDLEKENVPLTESTGRILCNDVISNSKIPPFNNSAMDGFAVKSKDTHNAKYSTPVKLKILDEIQAGDEGKALLEDNCAIRIMTGAPIPEGADSVVPVEDTKETENYVEVYKSLKIHENVRFAGEDIQEGQKVLEKGDLIRSADTGLLASLNYTTVPVFKQPEVAVISTGNEIQEPGETLKAGKIRNSNAYTLISEIKKYNAIPVYLGIAEDTPEGLKEIITKGLQCDIIVTTGGVSMGKYDYVKEVMLDLGFSIKTEKIRMKPGKPLIFGTKDKKLLFGLPGNPVSTMISFLQFVRPAILTMMGAKHIHKPLISAVTENEIIKKPDRQHYLRGYFTIREGLFHVSTTGPQGSGILRSMSEANCLIIVPEGVSKVSKGEKVTIQLINHEEIK